MKTAPLLATIMTFDGAQSQAIRDTCGNPAHAVVNTGEVTFEFEGSGNPIYYFYRTNNTADECYRMELKHLYQVAASGDRPYSEDLETWDWTWPPQLQAGAQALQDCPNVTPERMFGSANDTDIVPPPDMCSCLDDGSLCQFQMIGAVQADQTADLKIVNWHDPRAVQSFLKFDLYVSNEVGWVGAGAPEDGTVQLNFRLRNRQQMDDSDSDSDSDSDDDDSDDDDSDDDDDDDNSLLARWTRARNGKRTKGDRRALKQDDDDSDDDDSDDDDSDDDSDSDSDSDDDDNEIRCRNLDMFLGSVRSSQSGLNVNLGTDTNGDCALSIDTWTEEFESGYELIDPTVGLGGSGSSSGLSAGAIAGITIGTVFVAGGAAFVGKRQYDKRQAEADTDSTYRLV